MKIAIGADHGGWELKRHLVDFLRKSAEIEVTDFGTTGPDSVDYPDFGKQVAEAVSTGAADRGILICGTGIGMSMIANRYPRVRAALCHDHFTARMSRLHNDANVLCLGERVIGRGVACDVLQTWLATEFEGGRHLARVQKLVGPKS